VLKALATEPLHGYAVAGWSRETTEDALQIQERGPYTSSHRLGRNCSGTGPRGGWATPRPSRRFSEDLEIELSFHFRETEDWSRPGACARTDRPRGLASPHPSPTDSLLDPTNTRQIPPGISGWKGPWRPYP